MDKYKNKYRIKSHRMPGWDYSGNGYYFITLVTQNRKCNLGEIIDETMILSDFGKIIETEWNKSFEIRDELFSDEFIIMPNHIHAIIILKKTTIVETHGRASLQSSRQSSQQSSRQLLQQPIFVRKPKSISSFIAGFKSIINSKIDDYIDENNLNISKYNRNNHFFQPNYYDHIIRNNTEYNRIKNYIVNNPQNWKKDKLYDKQ